MQKTIVTCAMCSHDSVTYNPFMTLSLTCEPRLERSLQNFLKDDTLDNKDKYKCEKCKKQSKAKIRNELCKLPAVLVFHMKRFTFP